MLPKLTENIVKVLSTIMCDRNYRIDSYCICSSLFTIYQVIYAWNRGVSEIA